MQRFVTQNLLPMGRDRVSVRVRIETASGVLLALPCLSFEHPLEIQRRAQDCRAGTLPHSQSISRVEPEVKRFPYSQLNRSIKARGQNSIQATGGGGLRGILIGFRTIYRQSRLSSQKDVESSLRCPAQSQLYSAI
jgi:hypothetical protein